MSREIIVKGLASQKIIKVIPIQDNLSTTLILMNFLIENGITIASSCSGVGSCKKCFINCTLLSCQLTLLEFIKMTPSMTVEISYL